MHIAEMPAKTHDLEYQFYWAFDFTHVILLEIVGIGSFVN